MNQILRRRSVRPILNALLCAIALHGGGCQPGIDLGHHDQDGGAGDAAPNDTSLVDSPQNDAPHTDTVTIDTRAQDAASGTDTPDVSADASNADLAAAMCRLIVPALLDRYCTYTDRCCTPNELTSGIDQGIEGYCRDNSTFLNLCTFSDTALSRVALDPSSFQTCANAIAAQSSVPAQCGEIVDATRMIPEFTWHYLPECSTALRGLQGLGDPCSETFECQSHYCWSGQCIAAPVVGAACTGTGPCANGQVCVQGFCQTFGAQGASCLRDNDCEMGLYCHSTANGVPGTCAALLDDTAVCTSVREECHSGFCSAAGCPTFCTGAADR